MAAHAHDKEDKHGATTTANGHPFRNALLISLVLAAIILWQLNSVIHALHSVAMALSQAEGFRHLLGGLIHQGYHKSVTVVRPVVKHITH